MHRPADAADVHGQHRRLGQHGETSQTGLDNIDLWVGGLAEHTNLFGGLLGSTFNYVFEKQLTDLQNGDRLYYLARTPGMNLRAQLEGNSFAELVMRNTNAHTLKADPFATADCKFELGNLAGTAAGLRDLSGTVADDPRLGRATRTRCCCGSPTAPSGTGTTTRGPGRHQRPGRLQRHPATSTASAAAPTTTPSGAARATTSSRATTAPTSRSAARATTSSPTSPATTSPRAVPATTPSTAARAWTS